MNAQPTPSAKGLLHVSLPRRVVLENRGGLPTIYFGAEVIAFDDAPLAPLADALAAGEPFVAAEICPMADPMDLQAAVDTLRDIGLLGDHAAVPVPRRAKVPDLPAAAIAQDWRDVQAVAAALNVPMHPGHLELVVPVFRIAHPALDTDDRQVGEANTFPRALRLDRPTDWQTCTYAGTRHADDKPMNLTALKAMRAHWPEMMAVLADIRARYLARAALGAPLTLGQVERLCIAVLSLPTWEAFGGPLHPVLSSLFRVTDGLRIVVHQMMFVPSAEPMLPPETVVTAGELYDYAERSLSFHSDTGVCAGPQHFIAEFLSVIVEGAAPRFGAGGQISAAVADALSRLDAAMDYGFAALAAHAASFAIWPHMAEAWAEIAALPNLPQAWRTEADEAARRLEHASYLGQAAWRAQRLATYADMERQALSLSRQTMEPAAIRITCPDDTQLPADLAAILQRFATRAAAHLARASALQAQINHQMGRPHAPGFALSDMVLHARLVNDPHPRLQFLPEALKRLTGLTLQVETTPAPLAGIPPSTPVDQPRTSRITAGENP